MAITDPFANLSTLEHADIASMEAVCEGLEQPFDDIPDFDPQLDGEVDVNARLASDKSFLRSPSRRRFVDFRSNMDAYKHLDRLPREGESLHGVISGKYAQFEMIPAMLERIGRKISDLHICTLSYGRSNATDLLSLIDQGFIKRCSLLVSYFFKAQNRSLYDALVPGLRERGHRVLSMRTHCKIILAKFAGHGSFVCEGSANLRSCKNIEQFCLTRSRPLYNFHRRWLDDELLTGVDEGEQ